MMEVDNFCRFCKKRLRVGGVLSHCTQIFDKLKKPLSIAERFQQVRLVLTKTPGKSNRVCMPCVTVLSRLEKDLPVYWQWIESEKVEEAVAVVTLTTSDKRQRDTPSDTPRVLNKFCPSPTKVSCNTIYFNDGL